MWFLFLIVFNVFIVIFNVFLFKELKFLLINNVLIKILFVCFWIIFVKESVKVNVVIKFFLFDNVWVLCIVFELLL